MRKRNIWRPKVVSWATSIRAYLTKRLYNLTPRQRIVSASVAVVMLVTAVVPTVYYLVESYLYTLDSATVGLVGTVNKDLAAKLTYDTKKSTWRFNQPADTSDDSSAVLAALKKQAGGGGANDESLYSTDFPTDPTEGVTFADSQTKLSFTMTPKFKLHSGKAVDGRLIYPISGGAKLIYSAKNNGMKEDIVLPRFVGKELSYSYTLDLPSTLEARLQDDGSVGIFSADPILFGDVSTASDMDAEKLKSAREQGEKNHLLFAIPAPVIVQSGGDKAKATAKFGLSGNILTVTARDMDKVTYPASIDPSVVVTSTSDFMTNSGEKDDISYENDSIYRSPASGGSTSGWQSTSALSTSAYTGGSAVYNGYLYYIGNAGATGNLVRYAAINSNGTVGNWNATAALPSARMYSAAVPYNGRMYTYGGYSTSTNTVLDSVLYADINNDGTLGQWTTSLNNMETGVCRAAWTGYGGYLYAAGGVSGTVPASCGNTGEKTLNNTLQYAPILANGEVGEWATSSYTFSGARMSAAMTAYRGHLYLAGGTTDGASVFDDTKIAKISTNGDIDGWRNSPQVSPGGRYRHVMRAYNGYLYMTGGTNNANNSVYAQIYANGDIGSWIVATTMPGEGRWGHGFEIYKNRAYSFFGTYGGNNSTEYATIDPPGTASTSTTTTALGASIDAGTRGAGFVYNGYLYYIGGYTGSAYSSQVRYAAINPDGTVGAWSTTTALPAPAPGGSGLAGMGYALYNNRVYLIGGTTLVSGATTNVASVQYASFNSNGTLGSWNTTTDYPSTITNQSSVAYNGQLYVLGQTGGGVNNRIYRTTINNDGTVGSWNWDGGGSNNLTTSTVNASMFVYGKYLYVVGGGTSSSGYVDAVQYASINSDGSLGTWGSTATLTTAKSLSAVGVINGYLYVAGGETASGTYSSAVEFAKINSNGTISNWQTSTNLAASFSNGGFGFSNNTIYLISGLQGGSRVKNVLYLKTRSGGSGATSAWSTSPSTFTAQRTRHASAVHNGYLYVIGGVTTGSSYLLSSQYAKINDDGSVGSWSATTGLPIGLADMSSLTYAGRIYLFGGRTSDANPVNTVYMSSINNDGTLGSWNTTTALPSNRAESAIAARSGYVYLLGGTDGSSVLNTVISAPVNGNGSVGSWSAATSFDGARRGAVAVTSENYIYIIGGANDSTHLKDVQYAQMGSGGSIGSWSNTTDLTYARSATTASLVNGFLSIYGGRDAGSNFATVDYAEVRSDGTLSQWSSGPRFSNSRYGHQTATYDGRVYLTGGISGSTYYNDVQVASLQASSRIGSYSKLFDLGALYNISSISYQGILPGGVSAITYRTAGADGVLGNITRANTLSGTNGVCVAGDARYVLVSLSLDDTTRSVTPDEDSTRSYVTSLTVNYTQAHVATEKRLAHGKSFDNELLQPLDTCAS